MLTQIDHKGYQDSENLGTKKREASNTPLIPEASNHLSIIPEYPHQRHETIQGESKFFFDYLRFWGEGLNSEQGLVEDIIHQVIEGYYFITPSLKDRYERGGLPLLGYVKLPFGGAIRKGSQYTWSYRIENAIGVKLLVAEDEGGKIQAINLELSGNPLQGLFPRNNFVKPIKFIEKVLSFHSKLHLSRIDLTNEFPVDWLDLELFMRGLSEGNYCGIRGSKAYEVIFTGGSEGANIPTFYLGAKKSDKRICLYHTGEKHGYSALRYEMRHKNDRAKFLREMIGQFHDIIKGLQGEELNNFNKEIIKWFNGYLYDLKSFGFVDREKAKKWQRYDEMKSAELPFWYDFKEKNKVVKITYELLRFRPSIQGTLDWVIKNVATSMRVLADFFSPKELTKFLTAIMNYNAKLYAERGGYSERGIELMKELAGLGGKAFLECFSDTARSKLRSVGYFNKQYRGNPLEYSILDFMSWYETPSSC